ncbi:MAG: anion-transporting ArsA/GET3 family ATPase [Candidatus Aldehydirespiratoraceae bacterium]|jgi:anion-transporting  ArsA/GET3 family ATPase
MSTYRTLAAERSVIVCCGTGGVGKTTTAAATAMAAAAMGRRAVVVTIDPAKRLADALGIAALSNDPTIIDGPWDGTLAALMLDTKATFDDVVRHHATSDKQAEQILANRFYRNISETLSGTQDYMAVEKLAELHASGEWDLVVVDTPPTRDALAFLEAPKLLTRLLDNPIYKLLISPSQGLLRAVNRAAGTVVRQLSRVVGAEVVDDAIEFFQLFQGMEDGFRERAETTLALLSAEPTAFVLVASPRADTLAEAKYFLDRLGQADLDAAAVIVNRMLPALTVSPARANEIRDDLLDTPSAGAAVALADHAAAAAGDDERVGQLLESAPDALVVRVPLLSGDVHDVDTLQQIADLLLAGDE